MLGRMNAVALITGGSRGLGRGVALELARAGFDLVVNYARNEEAAAECVESCTSAAQAAGKSIHAERCRADISVAEERQQLVQHCRERFGRVDILVNNAGLAPDVRADILEATEASFDRLVGTNVKGPYFLTQQVARLMIEQGGSGNTTPTNRRKIITISSISAYTASVNRGDYCIAKAALSMLTPLYAARLAEYGINVYEIRPGVMATEMTAPVKDKYDKLIEEGLTPIKRWGTPEDVGKAVVAIALDLLPFSTGEVINVDGGFHLRRL